MADSPERFLIYYTPQIAEAAALSQAIADCLRNEYSAQAECAVASDVEHDSLSDGVDMLLAIGGDGTMLRVGRIGARHKFPVLGVNLGQLGFLLEVDPLEWRAALQKLMAGSYWLEERMMVYGEHWRGDDKLGSYHALNEIVMTRGALARPLKLETRIDASQLTTYTADGLIVSTPTGSTGYALAAGGPILPPTLHNLIMIPVAPHLSIDRAIVLAEGTRLDIVVHTQHQAILSADGQVEVEMVDQDRVLLRASERRAQFVRLQDRSYFYQNLTARLVFKGH